MQSNNITSIRQMLEQMTTEALRDMLDQELHADPVNDDAVRMLLSILRERRKNVTVEMTPNLERAWEKYQQDTDEIWKESRRSRIIRSWVTRAAAAAAVLIVLLIPIVPQEAGAESLWEALVRWTTEIVEFFGPEDNTHRIVPYQFQTDNPGLQQVYDAVVELGVTDPVVPMWLPEGYELVELEITENPAKTRVHSRFLHLDNETVFCVDIYNTDVSRIYQKNGDETNIYECGGVIHVVFNNNTTLSAIWEQPNIECLLVIDSQEETLKEILKSIYIRRSVE